MAPTHTHLLGSIACKVFFLTDNIVNFGNAKDPPVINLLHRVRWRFSSNEAKLFFCDNTYHLFSKLHRSLHLRSKTPGRMYL